MPDFKFQGFTTGEAVAVSASQGGETVSANVATWGEAVSSSMTLAVSANRTTGVAPMGALFSADATSNAARVVSPYHDIEGIWSYDDPGNFTALSNAPLWGTDWNLGYGPRGAHVFSQPGTYNVAHTAYDGEGQLTKSTSITVEDPDVVFAGADTAVVSGSGNFAGAPSGAAEFTSISAALSHLSGRSNQRLLLRANETFTTRIDWDNNAAERVYLGRFGSTTNRPLFDISGNGADVIVFDGDNMSEITVCSLRINGDYDPTATSQPNESGFSGIRFSINVKTAHKTVWDVKLTNIPDRSLHPTASNPQNRIDNVYVGNCEIIGWGNYGCLGGDCKDWAFVGCTIQQPTGTVNGSGKSSSPYWPDHGSLRMTRPEGLTVISNCDFSSFNDWSSGNSSRSMQTLIRWHNGGHVTSSSYPYINDSELVIDRFRGEGGNLSIFTNTNHATVADNYVVVDRFKTIHTAHSNEAVRCPMGGATFRNGVVVVPNSAAGASTGTREMFSDEVDENYQSGAGQRRSEFYSNALIDLRSNANATNRSGSASHDFVPGGYSALSGPTYFGENILHAPRLSSNRGGTTQHAPLDDTATSTPLYDGERWQGAPVDTSRAYTGEATGLFKPTAGSPAIGGATGKVSLLDFDGNLRSTVVAGLSRSTMSVGPFEPDLET